MVDRVWTHKNGTPADVLVITDQGPLRMSELIRIEKTKAPAPLCVKSIVSIDTVFSIDIRPGLVINADRIPKTDQLIHMIVRTNLGDKNVVTNLGGYYEFADFIGKTFMFVVNKPPVVIADVTSEAMMIVADGLVPVPLTIDYIIL